ncbi:hypothetical protein H5S09_02625 [Limosilactobacillus sp. STM2_1]|uniref:Phage protein n=1 Tax=Limosilactobacillus rudii TaxID=2759755 RepID=A0A7W3UL29_9LACO|nr:hypothetical protein [Limosilactobacillus rudii]MBB1080251.1 hypothetical protein [Limosilactobacillus rudii]MBB1096845.1 hypothetical protein [Limosilactobacillus rudii]MCD7133743.1 hypothetical protein [Limosilactobacillus rudii]
MDFDEIMTQIAANEKRRLEDMRAKAYMDHRLSEMIAFAFNDPAKMPKVEEAYPFVKDENTQAEQRSSDEPEWKRDQLLLMQQAQRIRQFNKDKGGGN